MYIIINMYIMYMYIMNMYKIVYNFYSELINFLVPYCISEAFNILNAFETLLHVTRKTM